MQISILIALGVFFLTSITLFILFLRLKKTHKKEHSEHSELITKYESLAENIIRIKEELSTKRIGYYQATTTLKNKQTDTIGDPYVYMIHVKELDRYSNGMSKIELSNIEIISGFKSDQYNWVKTCAKNNFSSLKKTSEIEWLESEESTKEMRKEKLKKIADIEKSI